EIELHALERAVGFILNDEVQTTAVIGALNAVELDQELLVRGGRAERHQHREHRQYTQGAMHVSSPGGADVVSACRSHKPTHSGWASRTGSMTSGRDWNHSDLGACLVKRAVGSQPEGGRGRTALTVSARVSGSVTGSEQVSPMQTKAAL